MSKDWVSFSTGTCSLCSLHFLQLQAKVISETTLKDKMNEKRPLRRQSDEHHFWSLIMLAVTAAASLLVVWVAAKALFVFLQEWPIP